jgi:hypothetical protein
MRIMKVLLPMAKVLESEVQFVIKYFPHLTCVKPVGVLLMILLR